MAAAEVEGSLPNAAAHPREPAARSEEPTVLPQNLVFVDLETTGGNAAYHRITEIGIVRVQNGELVEEWSSLVNPECHIPSYIEAFTGISNEMVAGAPRFADIAALVLDKLQAAVFVAHNARFDYSFLRSEFRRLDRRFCAKVLCTVKLSRRLFPQYVRHNLDAVMERNGLICSARHRALGDARVLCDFWFKLRREVPEARLLAAVQVVCGTHRLPVHLAPDLADELPEGPGAYRFFGENDLLLYVGRSNSLRNRVLEHLANEKPDSRRQNLASQVRRVDWVETAGELGAMLREAQWIKTQQPLYNRHVKSNARSFTLQPIVAGGGPGGNSGRVDPIAIDDVQPEDLTECFGLFHSEKDAHKTLLDIARARELCLKVLGLEEGSGSCFAFQIGKCRGACIGREPPILHSTRVKLALSSLKLKAWPFPGRIALRERDARSCGGPEGMPGAELHVIDRWTYLGTARSDEELATLSAKPASVAFDGDVYRILVRYFSSHPKLDWHDLVPRRLQC